MKRFGEYFDRAVRGAILVVLLVVFLPVRLLIRLAELDGGIGLLPHKRIGR